MLPNMLFIMPNAACTNLFVIGVGQTLTRFWSRPPASGLGLSLGLEELWPRSSGFGLALEIQCYVITDLGVVRLL